MTAPMTEKEFEILASLVSGGPSDSNANRFVAEARRARAAEAKLQAFKDYVHQRLDNAGVERDPESTHRAAGCRIGGRLDIVLTARAEEAEQREAKEAARAENAELRMWLESAAVSFESIGDRAVWDDSSTIALSEVRNYAAVSATEIRKALAQQVPTRTAEIGRLQARLAELEKQDAAWRELVGTLNEKLDNSHTHRCLYCGGTVTEKTSKDQLAELRRAATLEAAEALAEKARDMATRAAGAQAHGADLETQTQLTVRAFAWRDAEALIRALLKPRSGGPTDG